MGTVTTKSVCFWCKAKCYVNVSTKDGYLQRIVRDQEPPPSDRVARRPACTHREAAQEWFYNANRLNYPLKRKGEKGEARWEIVSWEQALDEIAERLSRIRDAHGPEALCATHGDVWSHTEYAQRFMNLFGSPNQIGPSPVCMGPRVLLPRIVMGWAPAHHFSTDTRCVVMLGIEARTGRPRAWALLEDIRKAGAKVIALDPRKTPSTDIADIWLRPRPGTDALVLLAWLNVIIGESLYDKEFVATWCHGFEAVRERVKEYTPERVSELTWVPKEQLVASARMYAETRPAVFLEGMGIEQQPTATDIMHARCILAAICGNLDTPGGEPLYGPHRGYVSDRETELTEALSPAQKAKQIGSDRFRLHGWPGQTEMNACMRRTFGSEADHATWYLGQGHAPSAFRAMLTGKPYPIRAMISQATNPLVSMPNTKLVHKAMKSLDLYVVMDLFMTPSAVLADYVLPAASWLERPHFESYIGYGNYLRAWPAALPMTMPGMYDRRADFDLWRGLGVRLGQEARWPWKTLEDSYTDRLRELGVTFGEFAEQKRFERDIEHIPRQYEKIGFATPTGKVELQSTILEKLGYDPLPKYVEPKETILGDPELAKTYPLTLTCVGRRDIYTHTDWKQVSWVRGLARDPRVEMHPETAAGLGVEDGEWVWIETVRGRVRMRAAFVETLDPRVVACDFDWWSPELPEEEPWLMGLWESNMNVLTDDDPDACDPALGSWPLRLALCRIYPARESLKVRRHREIEPKSDAVFEPKIMERRGE